MVEAVEINGGSFEVISPDDLSGFVFDHGLLGLAIIVVLHGGGGDVFQVVSSGGLVVPVQVDDGRLVGSFPGDGRGRVVSVGIDGGLVVGVLNVGRGGRHLVVGLGGGLVVKEVGVRLFVVVRPSDGGGSVGDISLSVFVEVEVGAGEERLFDEGVGLGGGLVGIERDDGLLEEFSEGALEAWGSGVAAWNFLSDFGGNIFLVRLNFWFIVEVALNWRGFFLNMIALSLLIEVVKRLFWLFVISFPGHRSGFIGGVNSCLGLVGEIEGKRGELLGDLEGLGLGGEGVESGGGLGVEIGPGDGGGLVGQVLTGGDVLIEVSEIRRRFSFDFVSVSDWFIAENIDLRLVVVVAPLDGSGLEGLEISGLFVHGEVAHEGREFFGLVVALDCGLVGVEGD